MKYVVGILLGIAAGLVSAGLLGAAWGAYTHAAPCGDPGAAGGAFYGLFILGSLLSLVTVPAGAIIGTIVAARMASPPAEEPVMK